MINILIQNDISTLQANSESGESMYHTNVGRKLKGGGYSLYHVCLQKESGGGIKPLPPPPVTVCMFCCLCVK